jgi:hypothetical protein
MSIPGAVGVVLGEEGNRCRLKVGQRRVTDGPFAETKEVLGGFSVIECDTKDEERKTPKDALDTAAKEWDKITERRGVDKQKAQWVERLGEMKVVGIEYRPDWAAKAK